MSPSLIASGTCRNLCGSLSTGSCDPGAVLEPAEKAAVASVWHASRVLVDFEDITSSSQSMRSDFTRCNVPRLFAFVPSLLRYRDQ